MDIVLFEDRDVAGLLPLVWTRPAFALRTASWSLLDWLRTTRPWCVDRETTEPTFWAEVRSHLQTVLSVDDGVLAWPDRVAEPGLPQNAPPTQPWTVLVNARLVPSLALWQELHDWSAGPGPRLAMSAGQVAYACLPASTMNDRPVADRSQVTVCELLEQVPAEIPRYESRGLLLRRPHDLVAANIRGLAENLNQRVALGNYQEIRPGVFAKSNVRWVEPIVTDTRQGAIVLEQDVEVGPFSLLAGPLHLDRHASVHPHANLAGPICVGQHTKIGGEVDSSIVDSYSNKKHHGFLGHSYIGSWVNLGAGTVTGNLKHTYGEVRVRYGRHLESTGLPFLGCMLGDYSRSAIHTGIFTGKVIGIGCFLFGMVTDDLDCFVNYETPGGVGNFVPLEMILKIQQRMFARRGLRAELCHQKLLQDVYAMTCGGGLSSSRTAPVDMTTDNAGPASPWVAPTPSP